MSVVVDQLDRQCYDNREGRTSLRCRAAAADEDDEAKPERMDISSISESLNRLGCSSVPRKFVRGVLCNDRFTARRTDRALHPAYVFDFITDWDLHDAGQRREAQKLQSDFSPLLVLGALHTCELGVEDRVCLGSYLELYDRQSTSHKYFVHCFALSRHDHRTEHVV